MTSSAKNNWKKAPIETVYLGLYDGPHATPRPASHGAIFLGIKNIAESGGLDFSEIRHIAEEDFPKWIRRVEPRPGDIVFTYEATLHRYAIIPEGFRGCLGRRLALIRPDPSKIDTHFLFYYFFSEEWRQTVAKYMLLGSTVNRIPITKFPEFEISYPPLPTQRKIAAILSAYDDLIENNTRRIALLEDLARLLYREWFVEFRFPGHAGVRMVDGVPEGCRVVELGEIAQQVRRNINPDQIEPETPYVGLEHIPRKSIALSEWGYARDVQSTKLTFQQNEILFGKIRPYFHKVVVAPVDGICSSDTIVIVPKAPEYFAIVLTCVSSEAFVDHATQTSQGTKMPRANWDVLVKYPVPLLPEAVMTQFNDFVQDIVQQIHNLVLRNSNLRRTRDLLLPKLVSGELDVAALEVAGVMG
jgi:type I restriction enzyme S subunit